MAVSIDYCLEPHLTAEDFIDLLRRSTLAERRPVDDPVTIAGMLAHADLIVTARAGGVLVGVSRAITDFSFCTYLSDLADEFRNTYPAQQVAAAGLRPYAFMEFDTFISRARATYGDARAAQNLDKLNDELRDVTKVMTKNIEDLLYRGDSLDIRRS